MGNIINREPIILCHAACTGGSLIYRLLLLTFNFIGLSEVSHVVKISLKNFMPLDPESQFYAQGFIDSKRFSDIFFERICHCNSTAEEFGKILLIREHSHSYFFNKQMIDEIDSVSWIEGRYRKIYEKSPYCLLSVRDPIDSWLGLRQSFPKEHVVDFNTYCEMYMNFLYMSEKTRNIFIFKYEDIVRYPEDTLLKISKMINIPFSFVSPDKIDSIKCSGNSGRSNSKLYIRSRRPFTDHLFDSAINSVVYKELCGKLGYDHLQDQIKTKERILMYKCKINNIIFNFLKRRKKNRINIIEILD